MWAYYDCVCMNIEETLFFETKAELDEFIQKGEQIIEKHFPGDSMLDENEVRAYEVKTTTVQNALRLRFSDWA